MDALELLTEDHNNVKDLFAEIDEADDALKPEIFEEIENELDAHTRIEETIFYPAMQQQDALRDMVMESLEEHKQVKTLLQEMATLDPASEEFAAKLKVLQENVEHHAEEEEEGKMFPKIRELCSSDELEDLGAKLEAAKGEGQIHAASAVDEEKQHERK